MDVAPTILYLLGQAILHDMDGRVIADLIDASFRNAHPIVYENRPVVIPEAVHF
jgi:hypothetical protein